MSYEINVARHVIKFDCSYPTTQTQDTADTQCLSIKHELTYGYDNYKSIVSHIRTIFRHSIKSTEKKYEDIDHKIFDTMKKLECIKTMELF